MKAERSKNGNRKLTAPEIFIGIEDALKRRQLQNDSLQDIRRAFQTQQKILKTSISCVLLNKNTIIYQNLKLQIVFPLPIKMILYI